MMRQFGFLKRVIVTPAVYPRSVEFLHFDIQVSEEVQFVTRGPVLEGKSIVQSMSILVEPFKWSVWLSLAGVCALYTWMIRSVENNENRRVRSNAMGQKSAEGTAAIIADMWVDKVRKKRKSLVPELSTHVDTNIPETMTQTAYNTCVSCAGVHSENLAAPATNSLRMIHAGWIFFIFVIAEVYGANLTAILTLGPETAQALTGLKGSSTACIETGCKFCVQTGAANEKYFREKYQPQNLQIVGKENILAQIEGILDGSCDATELTKEDLFKWTTSEHNAAVRCGPRIVGIPIVRRHRGMMAKAEKSCYITALNAVFARFATEPVDHAAFLNDEYFKEPACERVSLEDRDALAMTIQDLLGAFLLLGIITMYGFGITVFGRRAAHAKKIKKVKAFAQVMEHKTQNAMTAHADTALNMNAEENYEYSSDDDVDGVHMTQPQKTPM